MIYRVQVTTLSRGQEALSGSAQVDALTTPCECTKVRHTSATRGVRWQRSSRPWNAQSLFGWLTVITLLAAVALVDEQRATAIVTFVIGLLEGGGVAFLRTERQTAAAERDKAQAKVDIQCKDVETEGILEQLTAPAPR